MPAKNVQSDLLAKTKFARKPDRFGGGQRTTRASRTFRPVSITKSMHLIMKSGHAKGAWSFSTPKNRRMITRLTKSFAEKYGVKVLSAANAGNHLHFHIKVKSPGTFKAFLRALSGAIAIKVTGASKVNQLKTKFWTQTPFTRFVHGIQDFLRISDYLLVNKAEGFGHSRQVAELFIKNVNRARQKFRVAAGIK